MLDDANGDERVRICGWCVAADAAGDPLDGIQADAENWGVKDERLVIF